MAGRIPDKGIQFQRWGANLVVRSLYSWKRHENEKKIGSRERRVRVPDSPFGSSNARRLQVDSFGTTGIFNTWLIWQIWL